MITVHCSGEPSARDPYARWTPLPSTPHAAGLARRFLGDCLSAERRELYDVVALLTTELVANAVLHGHEPIRLQLRSSGATLRVEVSDGGDSFPVAPAGSAGSTEEDWSRRSRPSFDFQRPHEHGE